MDGKNERARALLRAAVMLILGVNAALVAKGISPLDNTILTEVLSYVAGAAAILWAWWKNNNVTEAAQEAQEVLNELKALGDDAAEELFDGEGYDDDPEEDPEAGEGDE